MTMSTLSLKAFSYKNTMQILSLILLLPWILAADNYCSLCPDHTMCFYNGIDPNCDADSQRGISSTEAVNIVNEHNKYRSIVVTGEKTRDAAGPQPSAADMQKLVWDNKLAEVAQKWADQCTFQHDSCRNDPRFSVGQNIYWSYGFDEPDWNRAIEFWYNEVDMFNSQLIWDRTKYIGCGRSSYTDTNRVIETVPLEYILSSTGNDFKTNSVKPRMYRQNLGFFGGLYPNPAGAQGALTDSTGTGKPGVQGSNPANQPTENQPTGNHPISSGGPTYPINPSISSIPINSGNIVYPMYPGGPTYPTYLGGSIYPTYPNGENYPTNPGGLNYPEIPGSASYPLFNANIPNNRPSNDSINSGSNANNTNYVTSSANPFQTPTSGNSGALSGVLPLLVGSAVNTLIASTAPEIIASLLTKRGHFIMSDPAFPMEVKRNLPAYADMLQLLQVDKKSKNLKSIIEDQHKHRLHQQKILESELQTSLNPNSDTITSNRKMLLQMELHKEANTRQFTPSRWQHLLICNYGPGGNVLSNPVYLNRSPCSECPHSATCKNGLCA